MTFHMYFAFAFPSTCDCAKWRRTRSWGSTKIKENRDRSPNASNRRELVHALMSAPASVDQARQTRGGSRHFRRDGRPRAAAWASLATQRALDRLRMNSGARMNRWKIVQGYFSFGARVSVVRSSCLGVDITSHRSKHVDEFAGQDFDCPTIGQEHLFQPPEHWLGQLGWAGR